MIFLFSYGVREYACTAVDMIARRIRLAFLNVEAAQEALPEIVNIMAEELNWNEEEKKVFYYKINILKFSEIFLHYMVP